MKLVRYIFINLWVFSLLLLIGCSVNCNPEISKPYSPPPNVLDYSGSPDYPAYRNSLAFSDQGAWFAYGFPNKSEFYGGFSGPFLMTQENGIWCSPVLSQLHISIEDANIYFDWSDFTISCFSYNSHLKQIFESNYMRIRQTLFFNSPHTSVIETNITNLSKDTLRILPGWNGTSFPNTLDLEINDNAVIFSSSKSTAIGNIQVIGGFVQAIDITDSSYAITLEGFRLNPSESKKLLLAQTFIFPEYNSAREQEQIDNLKDNHHSQLTNRILEKETQLQWLYSRMDTNLTDTIYKDLAAKTVLTLQNNWRIAAGELKHSGLFPSYHNYWFHGFWAWDSWKHAVALAQFNPELAKEQIRVMYNFMGEDGFIPDCIFRDTTIENHNYRNTKPPLSAWSIWETFKQDGDQKFLKELYPKILKQHYWWYNFRDHDTDSLCEYGSSDGTLIAARWESGMDNAVRFDTSQILQNSEFAYSLNQESVDLNAYLFAEKNFMVKIAKKLEKYEDAEIFKSEANRLKLKIQKQFFDPLSGWFYDTSLDGKSFFKTMGCEGWIPLWAGVATEKQASMMMTNMLDSLKFNTQVPLQTLSASHPEFKPDGGYWRGPNWIDQSYFGIVGLKNYGFHEEALTLTKKLIHNAEGVIEHGQSIRENYNPITGVGLGSENFSWSAAHYLLLLIDE